jgi:hypothetical protein
MHPRDCPEFEYSGHPDKDRVLLRAVAQAVRVLRNLPPVDLITNTRSVHRTLFEDLCPPGYEYYAGHYRGERYRCLEFYPVGIIGIYSDPRVGSPPERVSGEMATLAASISANLAGIDSAHGKPEAILSAAEKLLFSVAYACRLFVEFLTIHPYANGNGHIARWMLAAVLRRNGYRLNGFPIEPRPPDPSYTDMIFRYRNGEIELLEEYVLRRLSVFRAS